MRDGSGQFLKLAYRGMIGRVVRDLSTLHARSAVEVSTAIRDAQRAGSLPKSFRFMGETFARVARLSNRDDPTNPIYDWGIVAREPCATWSSRGSYLVPAFALFSTDEISPNHPTILNQVLSVHAANAEEFLVESVIAPIFDGYFSLLLCRGLQLEAHAQNVLFEIDEHLDVVAVVFRDAESVDKDVSLMEELGLGNPFHGLEYKCLLRGQYNYQIMHSFMFDFKLGEYLVTPLIKEAVRAGHISEARVRDRLRSHNAPYIRRLPEDFFPRDAWYSYHNVVHEPGIPREYEVHSAPAYR